MKNCFHLDHDCTCDTQTNMHRAIENVWAVFIGYQEILDGDPVPLFEIVGKHSQEGSTVTANTLKKLRVEIPPIPTFKTWTRSQK